MASKRVFCLAKMKGEMKAVRKAVYLDDMKDVTMAVHLVLMMV